MEQLKGHVKAGFKERMGISGFKADCSLVVPVPDIRLVAREVGKDHALAMDIRSTGIREARILAPMLADPSKLTEEEMEKMAEEMDSWDICDSICG